MQKKLILAIAVFTVGLIFLHADRSDASPYAFMMDRFEIVGNSPVYFVDDFNDSNLGSEWFVYKPTVKETDGVLVFSSPGSLGLSQIGNLMVQEEHTAINSLHPGILSVQDGAGDFTGRSSWIPILPQANQFILMEAFHHLDPENSPHLTEAISVGVSNFESPIADALGFASGLAMFFAWESPDGNFFVQSELFEPNDITDKIVLQLAFNDSDDLFTGSYSLNGGESFQSPFTALSPFALEGDFKWGMHASSIESVPIPAAVWLLGSGLIGLVGLRKKMKK